MEDHPVFSGYLGDSAEIVENKMFEKSIVKIAKGVQLTVEEEHYVQPLMKERDAIIPAMPTEDMNEDGADNGSPVIMPPRWRDGSNVGGGTLCWRKMRT